MSILRELARQTSAIVEAGRYTAPSGRLVEIGDAVRQAIDGTRLYTPEALSALLAQTPGQRPGRAGAGALPMTVTGESTAAAAGRLTAADPAPVLLLNYASAKNAGGGFINGARAQEEDLCRASALHACLLTQPAYYAANRAEPSLLYTDHLIYSPGVPFFRDDRRELLETPFRAAVLTAPAPNAGEHLRRVPDGHAAIREVLERRAGLLLALAEAEGHRRLVLGAWGCGVFRNDAQQVADVFCRWLEGERFAGAFDEVVFAIWGPRGDSANRAAFEARCPR